MYEGYKSEIFPKGYHEQGYYISVATSTPWLGLTAYNICHNNGKNPRLAIQIVAETLSMMEVVKQ